MIKHWPGFIIKVTLTLSVVIILTPTTSLAKSISKQQTGAIRQQLQQANANALVLVGTGKQPTIISNQAIVNGHQASAINPQRLFPIASFQKTITGIAIQQLINRHQLSLDTKLNRYLPRVTNSDQITIQQLMMHTSGLADVNRIAPQPLTSEKANWQFTMHNYRVRSQPGPWHYANVNYGLLAMVVAKASHQSYQRYVQKHIFNYYGLHGLKFFTQTSASRVVPSLTAAQHHRLDPSEKNNWHYLQREMSAEYGAGQVLATPQGYWQLMQKTLLNHHGIGHQYQQILFKSTDNPYYGGIYLHQNAIHANGSYAGYACTMFADYKTKKTLILFSNNITLKQCRQLGHDLDQIYFGSNHQAFPY